MQRPLRHPGWQKSVTVISRRRRWNQGRLSSGRLLRERGRREHAEDESRRRSFDFNAIRRGIGLIWFLIMGQWPGIGKRGYGRL
jgi:hypothetical protein